MKKHVKDLEVAGKKVLVRCDFNVPLKSQRTRTFYSKKEQLEMIIESLQLFQQSKN